MRVLIIPLVSLGNGTTDSNFRVYEDLIENAPSNYHFYMTVPNRMTDEQLVEPIKKHPNCTFIRTEWYDDFWTESTHIPETLKTLFAQRGGKYPIDIIVTSKTPAVTTLKAQLGDFRRSKMLPIHIFEPLVRVDQTHYQPYIQLMTAGYRTAQTWYLNNREQEIAYGAIRGKLGPMEYIKAKERGYVDGLGVNTKDIDKAIEGVGKSDRFQIIWGGRMSAEKDPEKFMELMEKFYSFGRDVKHIVTSHQISPKQAFKLKGGYVEEIKYGCPRDEFWGLVASSHMFLCTSKVEGFPVGFWEQLYICTVGIFPANKWVKESIPKEYPFIYNNMTEAHTMIRWIENNYEEAVEQTKWIREWIKERYDSPVISKRFYERIENQYLDETESLTLGGIGKVISTILKGVDEISWEDLLAQVKKEANTYDPNKTARFGQPSIYDIHQFVKANGFIDTGEGELPNYKKEKV